MKRLAVLLLFAAALLPGQELKRVAVLPADAQVGANVRDQLSQAYGGQSPAVVLADYMAAHFSTKSGSGYVLVERTLMSSILGEQANVFSDDFARDASTKLRNLKVAQYLMGGRVSHFSVSHNVTPLPGPKLPLPIPTPKMAAVTIEVNISLSGKLIGVSTGEYPAGSANARVGKRKVMMFRGPQTGQDEVSKLANEAMQQAARMLVDDLLAKAATLPNIPPPPVISENVTPKPPVPQPDVVKPEEVKLPESVPAAPQAILVAEVDGARVGITEGAKANLKVGDRLEVKRPGKILYHPVTKERIGQQMDSIEFLTVTEVQPNMAFADTAGKVASKAKLSDVVVPAAPQTKPVPVTVSQVSKATAKPVAPQGNR